MINDAVKRIIEFQNEAGQYVSGYPRQIPLNLVKRRAKWISDELEEFVSAINIYEQADAITDLLYYVLGAYAEIGINPDPLFEIIHSANMRKLDNPENTVKDKDGKVLKPHNWKHPDAEIRRYIDKLCVR